MSTAVYDGPSFEEEQMYDGDKRLGVQFFYDAVQNEFKSNEEGRPIFDQIAFIRIFTPGSRDVFVSKANEVYQRRFERQWERFLRANTEAMDGTPLEQATWITVAQLAELKSVNCYTIEHLADMSDVLVGKMMGALGLRERARRFLEAAKESAPLLKLTTELEKRDAQIALLQQQMQDILAAQQADKTNKIAVPVNPPPARK
jgi:hypothetical protein